MKRRLFSLLAITVIGGILFTTSCKIDDTVAPVVTLKGDATMSVDFGGTFTDPGATATDDNDNDLTVTTEGTVNVNAAGEYTLTYKATDAAGNIGSITRTVYVVHRKTNMAGTYSVSENCTGPGGPYTVGPYSASITPGAANNMALVFNNFGDFTTSVNVNGSLSGNAGLSVTIPQQVPGTTIEGSGTVNAAGTTVTITYTSAIGGNTDTCQATWTKQ